MAYLKPTVLLVMTLLALAGCKNPKNAGGAGTDGPADGFFSGSDAINTAPLGDPSDPTSVAYFNQSVGDRVLFAVDQSNLSDEGRRTLDGQAGWLLQNKGYGIVIEGHADEQGTREYNLALGARRADAVKAYLVSLGLTAGRIRTVSYGKERPLEICSQESCYAQNRRAVTLLLLDAAVSNADNGL